MIWSVIYYIQKINNINTTLTLHFTNKIFFISSELSAYYFKNSACKSYFCWNRSLYITSKFITTRSKQSLQLADLKCCFYCLLRLISKLSHSFCTFSAHKPKVKQSTFMRHFMPCAEITKWVAFISSQANQTTSPRNTTCTCTSTNNNNTALLTSTVLTHLTDFRSISLRWTFSLTRRLKYRI